MSNLGFATQLQAVAALTEDGLKPKEIAFRMGIPIGSVYSRQTEIRQGKLGGVWPEERLARLHRIHEAALGVIAEAFGVELGELRVVLRRKPVPAQERAAKTPAEEAKPVAEPAVAALAPEPVEPDPSPVSLQQETPHAPSGPLLPQGEKMETIVAPPPGPIRTAPRSAVLSEAAAALGAAVKVTKAPEPAEPSPSPVSLREPPSPRRGEEKRAPGVRTFRFVEVNGQFLRRDGRGFTSEPDEAWSGNAEAVGPARKSLRDAKFCKSREIR